jgi:hypothetical protein
MEEPYVEGVAIHDDPESCGCNREVVAEALTGARAGRVLSREIGLVRSADTVIVSGRQHEQRALSRVRCQLRAVEDPEHVRNLPAREPGELWDACRDGRAGRIGKATP